MIDYQINPKYKSLEKAILDIPRRFDQEGEVIDDGRNVIKILDVEGERFNVKSFKKPNIINQFAYAYVRKGKAQRSFEYANILLERGVGTPEPIAYIVYRNVFGVTRSFYISNRKSMIILFGICERSIRLIWRRFYGSLPGSRIIFTRNPSIL